MGSTSSKATVVIDTTQLNSTVFNFLQQNQTTSSATVVSNQSINASNIRSYGCVLNIENKADINVTQIQQFTQESATQLQQSITTQLQSQANAASSASSELGSQGSDSETNVYITNEIKNSVEQSVTLQTLNEMVTQVNSDQTSNTSNIIFDPCGFTLFSQDNIPKYVYEKCDTKLACNIDNDLAIHSMSTLVVNSVTSALMNNLAVSNVVNTASASSSAKSTGLAGIVTSLFDGIAGVFGSIFGGSGGVIIVIVLLIIAALAYFFLKNGGAEKMAAMTPQGRMAMATGAVSAPPAVAVAGT